MMEGKMVMISGKIYQIKEQLHKKLYLAEEMEVVGDDLVHTGSEVYITDWELKRYGQVL